MSCANAVQVRHSRHARQMATSDILNGFSNPKLELEARLVAVCRFAVVSGSTTLKVPGRWRSWGDLAVEVMTHKHRARGQAHRLPGPMQDEDVAADLPQLG